MREGGFVQANETWVGAGFGELNGLFWIRAWWAKNRFTRFTRFTIEFFSRRVIVLLIGPRILPPTPEMAVLRVSFYAFVIMIRLFIIAGMCALSAYQRHKAPKSLVLETAGTNTKRVLDLSALPTRHPAFPTAAQDAQFIGEPAGETSKPSNSRTFYRLVVTPQDLPQWTRLLSPLAAAPEYVAPAGPPGWWITRDAFPSLQFYQSMALTGGEGWVGIAQETNQLYIFSLVVG